MNKKIKAVVFDLDGLMLNTEDIFDLAGHELMKRRGKVMTKECQQQMLGRRPNEAFTILKQLLDVDDSIEALLAETKDIFAGFVDDHLQPMPGVFDILDRIEAASLPKAVATSSPRQYMIDMMTRFDLLERFPISLTAEDVTHGKPDPEIYLKAAELLNVSPGNMLVLEDSEAGTRAAASAGAVAVSVPNRHTVVQNFDVATLVANSLEDPRLLALLD